MARKKVERKVTEDPRYHNTWKLLKKYRDVVWSLDIEHQARCIERSHKMLTLVQNAVDLLRTRHKNGEAYYWLLHYTYLSPQQLKNVEEIIEQLRPHIHDISFRTYYRRRKEAIEALSSVLWGYTAQDSLQVLEQFFPAEAGGR